MCRELKIKIKSLAAEAVIIKKEERKQLSHARYTKGVDDYRKYHSLVLHRKDVVRFEARATHLAYACIRGKKNPELKFVLDCWAEAVLVPKVAFMVAKYGEFTWKSYKWKSHTPRYEASDEIREYVKNWLSS